MQGVVSDDEVFEARGGVTRYAQDLEQDRFFLDQFGRVVDHRRVDETLELVRDQFRRFADQEVAPYAQGWHERDELVPVDVIEALAGLGVFGVITLIAAERTTEVGIRMALGARPADVLKMMLGQAARLSATGVLIGALGALALTPLLEAQLFGVGAQDPLTFLVVAAGLMTTAVAAAYLPARRAMSVDPVNALHGDLGLCNSGDAALLLSNSGATEELLRLLPLLKRFGVTTVTITGKHDSPLARASDAVLLYRVPREACPLKLAPTASIKPTQTRPSALWETVPFFRASTAAPIHVPTAENTRTNSGASPTSMSAGMVPISTDRSVGLLVQTHRRAPSAFSAARAASQPGNGRLSSAIRPR